MSRARRARSSPVSLFPFLAVLVSTIGALILLLLSIKRQAAAQALAAAARPATQRAPDEADELTARHGELRARLAELHDRLRGERSRERNVDQSLESVGHALSRDETRGAAQRQQLDDLARSQAEILAELTEITEQMAQIERLRGQLRADATNASRTFEPIIHPGARGTVRRPLYIECVRGGVILQPEGVGVPLALIDPDQGAAAPLPRALAALAGFYADRTALDGLPNADRSPYPVLLVRPEGIEGYYASRATLERAGLDFGYDLIESDWILRYPEVDPAARGSVLAALEAAVGAGLAGGERGLRTIPGTGRAQLPALAPRGGNRQAADGAEPAGLGARADRPGGRSEPLAPGPRSEGPPTRPPALSNTGPRLAGPANGSEGAPAPRPIGLADLSAKVAIPRNITADCLADRLIIGPERRVVAIPSEGSLADTAGMIQDEIARQRASWSDAGRLFRWLPRLVCRVPPDALDTYYRLRLALVGSDLEVDHEPAFEDATEDGLLEGVAPPREESGQNEHPVLDRMVWTQWP